MSNNNDSGWIVIVGAILFGLGALAVWKFSTFFGLDMATGWNVLVRLAVVLGLVVVAVQFFDAEIADIWPLGVAGVWIAWWPALDYWALQTGIFPAWDGFNGQEASGVWWSAGYTKWGVALAVLAIGYSFRKWLRDR